MASIGEHHLEGLKMFPTFTTFDTLTGLIDGAPLIERRLSALRGYFVDE